MYSKKKKICYTFSSFALIIFFFCLFDQTIKVILSLSVVLHLWVNCLTASSEVGEVKKSKPLKRKVTV